MLYAHAALIDLNKMWMFLSPQKQKMYGYIKSRKVLIPTKQYNILVI